MATHRENFKAWYVTVLESLYSKQDAGFIIVMVALPLLERYLRQKVGVMPQANLPLGFYEELLRVFPELQTSTKAREFWQVYRNGLLHEVTFSHHNRKGKVMPVGWLSDKPGISIHTDGSFWLNPRDFAKIVIKVIDGDFATFEGSATAAQLPLVEQTSLPAATPPQPSPYLGTRSRP
jgi:hypothetical protein